MVIQLENKKAKFLLYTLKIALLLKYFNDFLKFNNLKTNL